MAKNTPRKHYRIGISLMELFEKFPNNRAAEDWFIVQRWPKDIICRIGAVMSAP